MTDQPATSAAKPQRRAGNWKPDMIQLSTDAGELIVDLIGGAKPYLWIGRRGDDGDEYLDSIEVERIEKAVRRMR